MKPNIYIYIYIASGGSWGVNCSKESISPLCGWFFKELKGSGNRWLHFHNSANSIIGWFLSLLNLHHVISNFIYIYFCQLLYIVSSISTGIFGKIGEQQKTVKYFITISHGISIYCIWLETSKALCFHRHRPGGFRPRQKHLLQNMDLHAWLKSSSINMKIPNVFWRCDQVKQKWEVYLSGNFKSTQ